MTHIAVVGEVAAGPVHVAHRAEQDIRQCLVQRLGAVQQLVRHCEQQPSLAAQAHGQTCTQATTLELQLLKPGTTQASTIVSTTTERDPPCCPRYGSCLVAAA